MYNINIVKKREKTMFKLMALMFGFEYTVSSLLVEKSLKKLNLALPQDWVELIKNRVYRLRLELRLLSQFMWFITAFYALPMQLKIWDLEWQLWVERFFNPIFQFLAFCQGFVEGTLFGFLIAIAFWIAANWYLNQKAKRYCFYLLYRCGAIE
jgi:hypothetical protein